MADSLARDIKTLRRKLEQVSTTAVPRAVNRALNIVAPRAKRQGVNQLAADVNLPKAPVNKKVFVRRSTPKVLEAVVNAYTRPVNVVSLIRLATLQSRKGRGTNARGVTVRGRTFRGAFINVSPEGNYQVYQRQGFKRPQKKGRYAGKVREEVDTVVIPIQGPARAIFPKVAKRLMRTDFPVELRRDLQFRLDKVAKSK